MVEPRKNHASIVDVARLAGVSTTTVSRSLRGLRYVSEATRAKVEAAARELNYVASPAGSGLASGRTRSVGVVVPLITRWFFAQVIAGAVGVLQSSGYGVLLYCMADEDERDRLFQRLPMRRRVDGVLVVSLPLAPGEVKALKSLQVPVVTIGCRDQTFPGVRIDDEAGTLTAVRHLKNLGHTSIAMITALEDENMGFASARDRRIAFASLTGGPIQGQRVVAGVRGVEGGARAMEMLLGGERLPTAVFAEYDEMAFGAILTLRRAGLDVPADMSVVGFDDHEMAEMMELTTVAQPVRAQGEVAARLLLDALQGAETEGTDVVLATRLVVRGSTAPYATRQPEAIRAATRPGGE